MYTRSVAIIHAISESLFLNCRNLCSVDHKMQNSMENKKGRQHKTMAKIIHMTDSKS